MIHWVDGCFKRWGVWVQMGRGLGSAGLSAAWGSVGRSSVRTSFVPIRSLEDSRTDDWVKTLPFDDQALMLQLYCTSQTSVQHARVLKMSTRTIYARLHSIQVAYTRRNDHAHKATSENAVD